jgi:NitT/TauT family transport system substrate-binding protein
VARGIAKAQLFQEVNPEASVLIHWKVYPQSMPRAGQTEEEIEKAADVVSVRRDIQSEEAMETGRYGDVPAERMESFQEYLKDTDQLEELIDVSRYYTNDMIDEINDFDRQAIIDMANNFKLD